MESIGMKKVYEWKVYEQKMCEWEVHKRKVYEWRKYTSENYTYEKKFTNEKKHMNENFTSEKYTNGKKHANEKKVCDWKKVYVWKADEWKKYTNENYTKIIRIKKVKEWEVNKRKILMKSMRTEKSIERKTFVKCLFDKTKLKVHPIK